MIKHPHDPDLSTEKSAGGYQSNQTQGTIGRQDARVLGRFTYYTQYRFLWEKQKCGSKNIDQDTTYRQASKPHYC